MSTARLQIVPTGRERTFGEEEIIVSKTDAQGRITYVNDVFLHVSRYPEDELIGAPHSLIRHPDMPRAVFKLLWDRIQAGREVFAYINNLCADGDHYWVFAHVTPSFDATGRIVGFHSNRRSPERRGIDAVRPLYERLRSAERAHPDRRDGLVASSALLDAQLAAAGLDYDHWIWTI